MKAKIHLLILFIIVFSLNLKAQIGNEIKTFVDSTELMVNNGRKMLVQKVMEGNYEKAKEVYHYLKNETKDNKFSAFYYTEELYLDFLFSDWNQWTEKAANYNRYAKNICYQNVFQIDGILYSELAKKADFFTSLIPTLEIDPESRRVMAIYIHYVKVGTRDDDYSRMVKEFHKEYKTSRFDDFFSHYLPKAAVKGSWSWTLGTSGFFPTGKLADKFSSNMGFGMAMDVNFGKIYASMTFDGGPTRLKVPFNAIDKDVNWEFGKDEKFQYFQGGVAVGYFVTRNQRYHFAPFVSIGGAQLQSNRYDSKDDDKEFKILNSFYCGPGIHTEIKLKQFHIDDPYRYGGSAFSYISLKLDGGYNIMTQTNFDEFKGNMAYFKFGFVWGIGYF